jgi:hypothetical protein
LVLTLQKNILVRVGVLPAEKSVLCRMTFHAFVNHPLLWSRTLTLGEVNNTLVARLDLTFLVHLVHCHWLVVMSLIALLELHLLVHFLLIVQNWMLTQSGGLPPSKLPGGSQSHAILLDMLGRSALDRVDIGP